MQWITDGKTSFIPVNYSVVAQLSKVTVNEDSGLPETDLTTKIPLKLESQPVATTFAIVDE